MKRIIILITMASLVGSLAATTVLAQGRMGQPRGYGYQGSQQVRLYDPATVETLSGEVIRVNQTTGMGRGRGGGVHLLLKTRKEAIEVHLGPTWYLGNQKFSIAPGDRLEIKGSRVTAQGVTVIIAAQVKKGNDVLTLRNNDGFPMWSGRR